MKKILSSLLFSALAITGTMSFADESVHAFKVKNIEGEDVDLSGYKGKVLLIVNVASKCGATKQYDPLQALYKKYEDKGLVVLGFPANNFGGQEPGSDEEIAEFCSSKYSVEFPMFSKVSVKGDDKAPLFNYLTAAENPDKKGEIGWNFEKFLIGKDGRLIRRFATKVDPTNSDLVAAIESALAE